MSAVPALSSRTLRTLARLHFSPTRLVRGRRWRGIDDLYRRRNLLRRDGRAVQNRLFAGICHWSIPHARTRSADGVQSPRSPFVQGTTGDTARTSSSTKCHWPFAAQGLGLLRTQSETVAIATTDLRENAGLLPLARPTPLQRWQSNPQLRQIGQSKNPSSNGSSGSHVAPA